MIVKLDDLRHELVGIYQLVQRRLDRALIVAAGEDLRRDLPHVGHLLIEAENLTLAVDHQNAVGRRLQRRAQQRERAARLRLRFPPLGDVLDETNQIERLPIDGSHDRHGQVHPDDASILPYIALLHPVLGELTVANASNEIETGRNILGMRQILDLRLENLFARIARDVAVALINRYPLLVEGQMSDA